MDETLNRKRYLYGFVKNDFPDTPLTFVKGLIASLDKTELPVEPFTSYFQITVGENEENINKNFPEDPETGQGCGFLWGQLGHCYEIIHWASGGLYWGDELKEQKEKGVFNGPTEFTMNVWNKIDDHHYESVFDLTFQGVKWLDVGHADNQGASDCWGLAYFTYEKKVKNLDYKPMKCEIPSEIKYPILYIGKLLGKHAVLVE